MKVITSVTRIELDSDEKQNLKKALEILIKVNDIIGDDNNIDYVVDNADMDLYDDIYDEINRIEDWVTRE